MGTPRISPRRPDLLQNLAAVSRWPDGSSTYRSMGRDWKVNADIAWLTTAGLVEVNPDDADLDIQGYIPTIDGKAVLNTVKESS
jgi:hypothetical protein